MNTRGTAIAAKRLLNRFRYALPEGRSLPTAAWDRRHHVILALLWLHVIGLSCWGIIGGKEVVHSLGEAGAVGLAALLAGWKTVKRQVRSAMATLGLLTSSALVVHLSGGYIEMHFHFFVMVIIIALYQDWFPFLLAVGYVVVHHGVVGVLAPTSVYNHPAAWAHPWQWAAIHAVFVMAASIASLVNWRLSERAYAHSELILGSAGEGIFGLDLQGKITFANPAAARMLGWENGDVIGRPMREILPYWKPTATLSLLEEHLMSPVPKQVHADHATEDVFRRKDGTAFPVEYVRAPIREKGDVVGAVIVFKDITERKRAEETTKALVQVGRALSQSLNIEVVGQRIANSIRGLLGALCAFLFRVDPKSGDWVIVAVSGEVGSGFRQNLVYPREVGATGLALRQRRPVVTPDVLNDPRIVFTPDVRAHVEQATYRAVLALPLLIQERAIGVLAVGDEIGRVFTDQEIGLAQAFADQAATALENARLYQEAQQAYEELTRTQDQLIQSQKIEAIGRLAGGVAHDFNNLLTIITGRSQLLLTRLRPEDAPRKDIELIQKTATRAAALTQQLLAFSRKQVLQPKVVDLNALVMNMDKMLRRLIGEDVELNTLLDQGIARVKADPVQFEQILLNLAVNARDAMPRGGRLILQTTNVELDEAFVRQHHGSRSGPHVMLTVTDTGCGMDAQTQAHIFEPFFTTKVKGKGTGLGLSTVYGIVKQHDGYISVESQRGRGTTFKIYLQPVADALEPSEPTKAPIEDSRGSETILLVEDEETLRDLVREILQVRGYAVLEASSPDEALVIGQRHAGPIHLVLTDVVMPKMSGREVVERLRPLRPSMKVLYMSGYTDDALGHHGVLDPRTALLQKPFTPDVLAREVRKVLASSLVAAGR